jgi:hypothetical protein
VSGEARGWSTGRAALGFLVLFLVFSAAVLPGEASQARVVSNGAGLPDTSLFYRAQDYCVMAQAYGVAGREAYIKARFSFDLVYPLVNGGFLMSCIGWSIGRSFNPDSHWQWAALIPLLGMGLDYLENICTSPVMLRYPATTPLAAASAPAFTLGKLAAIAGSFALLIAGTGIMLIRRIRS